jgi:hypothetical protein
MPDPNRNRAKQREESKKLFLEALVARGGKLLENQQVEINGRIFRFLSGEERATKRYGTATWILEYEGHKIISGIGISKALDAQYNRVARQEFKDLLDIIFRGCYVQPTFGNKVLKIKHNLDKDGIEIIFKECPDISMINRLRNLGFQYSGVLGKWWARWTYPRWNFATSLIQETLSTK